MDPTIVLSLCIAGAVTGVTFFVMRLVAGNKDNRIADRLSQRSGGEPVAAAATRDTRAGISQTLQKIGQAAAEPFMPKTRDKQSAIRRKLGMAGIYSPAAIKVMTGAKVILMGSGLLIGYLVGDMLEMLAMGISVGGLLGYLLPTTWLNLKIKANQQALTYGLPDALDLMVVCVESGLTVDASMQRVGQELGLAHPALSRELAIAHMETRVGLSRSEAMRNLGQRTGCECLIQLASMLIQADRFGTSIAQALRVQADTLRANRQAAAEELAAKASVKMSFPLVLFIFPATFIVLAGPTVIGLMNSDLFK